MIKESYQYIVRQTSVSVSQSKVEAVMKKNITKSGCRMYDGGFIGVAGTLGNASGETWAEAKANLDSRIPYPFEPERNLKRVRDLRELNISDEEFIAHAEYILTELRSDFPDFIFSNKVNMVETEISLRNDVGLDCVNYDKTLEYWLLVKHKDSVNVIDNFIGRSSRRIGGDDFLNESRRMLRAYNTEAALPQRNMMPVIFWDNDGILSKITESLNGEEIGLGTSLFTDKTHTAAFSDRLCIYQDMTPDKMHTPFFDMEGVTNPRDICFLIKGGVIEKAYTDKNTASRFSCPLTGSAGGAYDDVPSLKTASLSVLPSEKTLKELLNGEMAALVVLASGGDYTGAGDFASPVQMSYLTDGERIFGRLPEFNVSGNIYSLFGSDFIGLSKDRPFFGERNLVLNMKIDK